MPFPYLGGIRQGDPISPYLFLFISEVLSMLIKNACGTNLLHGFKLNPGGLTLSHLLFVDDTLIFLKAATQNCENISHLLQAYYTASKQQVSLTKSNVVFSSNTPSSVHTSMCETLGMPDVTEVGKYLGLPTSWDRAKKEALMNVKDRILRNVHDWNQQFSRKRVVKP